MPLTTLDINTASTVIDLQKGIVIGNVTGAQEIISLFEARNSAL